MPTFTRGYTAPANRSQPGRLNLADQLKATDADVACAMASPRTCRPKAAELRDRMIVAAKALLGLTSQVCMKYFSDDPRTASSARRRR